MIFAFLLFSGGNTKTNYESARDRPNVLFIAVDNLNDWTGFLEGHPQARTPNLDRLAESGIVFTNAYAPSPSCGPSRTAILYGRHPHVTGAYGNSDFYSPNTLGEHGSKFGGNLVIPNIFRDQKSIPTVFNENGYYTAGAGKISHFTQTPRFPPNTASYFPDAFDNYFEIVGSHIPPDSNNPESENVVNGMRFGPMAPENVEKQRDMRYADWAIEQLNINHDQPFFLALGFEKPHFPWVAPQSYYDQYNLDEIQLPEVPEGDLKDVPHAGKIFAQSIFGFRPLRYESYPNTEHEYVTKHPMLWKRMVRAYLATSSYMDAMVGKVLNALKESSYADNTIVVLWSDHGFHLGEKEHWRMFTLWETGTRSPLIIRVPGVSSNGQSVEHPVSLQDLFPTLIDLCELKIDQKLDGNSLGELLKDPSRKWDKPALMSFGPGNFAVRLDEWRYIRYQNGDEELYNLNKDPKEFDNLAREADYEQVIERLRQHIPNDYVTLYSHLFSQFTHLDTMEVFIDNYIDN